jgi:hypothetical protein
VVYESCETTHHRRAAVPSNITSIRLPPQLLADLKALARNESVRRGEFVSWARLVREEAAKALKRAKRPPPPLAG